MLREDSVQADPVHVGAQRRGDGAGQGGLADAGGADQHDAAAVAAGQRRADRVELHRAVEQLPAASPQLGVNRLV